LSIIHQGLLGISAVAMTTDMQLSWH